MKYKILSKEKKIQFTPENQIDACELGQVFTVGAIGGELHRLSEPYNRVYLEISYKNLWRSLMWCANKEEARK